MSKGQQNVMKEPLVLDRFSRRTVCLNWARTGLWGGRGVIPASTRNQTPYGRRLVPRYLFRAKSDGELDSFLVWGDSGSGNG